MTPEEFNLRPLKAGDRVVYNWIRNAHGLHNGEAYTVRQACMIHSERDHIAVELEEHPRHVFPITRFVRLGRMAGPP